MSKERAMILSVILNKDRGKIDYYKFSKTLNELYEPYSRDGMNQKELGKKFGYGQSLISKILPVYPNLKKYENIHTFSNGQLCMLARVKNKKLRGILVERTKERDWGSTTIGSRATRFNKLTDFLEDKIDSEDLKDKVLDRLIEDLGDSLLEYDFSALRNEAKSSLEEERKKRIIEGDMFEKVPKLGRKFDCVITDPPYGVSWAREYELEGRKNIDQNKGVWDHFSKGEYLSFTEKWLKTVKPKIKNGGGILIFTADIFLSHIIDLLNENGFRDRKTIVWHKKNPTVSVEQDNFVSSVEYIVYATKGSPNTFNWLGQNESHNLIDASIANNPTHPTQKPVEVIKQLLKFVTNNGDWILDPFAGSGSTAIACDNLDRNWTMIEKESKFVKMIERRVDSE